MAIQILLLSPLLLLLLLLLLPLFVLLRKRAASQHSQIPLPPSPPGIPFLGNLHQLGLLPHRSLTALAEKHGPLMLLHLGQVPTLVVSSANTAREVTINQGLTFASRPKFKVAQALFFGSMDMILAPYGEHWKQTRKLAVTHLFNAKMVQSLGRMREEEVDLMINNVNASASSVINMSEVLYSFTNDALCRVVSGKFSMGGRRNSIFRHLIEETNALFGAFHVEDYLPYLGWVDVFFGLNAKAERTSKGYDDVFEEVIKDHASRSKGDDGIEEDGDFVDVLLSLQKDQQMDFQLTKNNIKALLLDMFAAGTETSYVLLEWAMAELVRNHEAMMTLQDEIRRIAHDKGKVREEDLREMRYLKCVLKEVLRLHPPLPLLLPRESMEDSEIQGYRIPKKTRVIINAWALSRDPKFWEAPEEFRPERFIDSAIDFKGNDLHFIPFGAGRRICPGMNFAMTTTELALANLVNQFDWGLPEGMTQESMDMTEAPGLAVHRKQKLHLIAMSYKPKGDQVPEPQPKPPRCASKSPVVFT